jgi:hypothetical protein
MIGALKGTNASSLPELSIFMILTGEVLGYHYGKASQKGKPKDLEGTEPDPWANNLTGVTSERPSF